MDSYVIGIDDLDAALTRLENIDVKKPMEKSVEMVEAAAKANAPVHLGSLRSRIAGTVHAESKQQAIGEVTADAPYAAYVEFGTGPKGAADHAGVAPDIPISYRSNPWFIPEDELPPDARKDYHWRKFKAEDGKVFYICYGQAAQPFMYPAIKDNEDDIKAVFREEIEKS